MQEKLLFEYYEIFKIAFLRNALFIEYFSTQIGLLRNRAMR